MILPSRRTVLGLGGVLAVAGLGLWRRSTSDANRIVLGVLAPFGTTPGEGIRHGVRMAVEEVNATGGMLGRRVEVIEIDVGFSAEDAVRGYQKLAGAHRAVAVIGLAGDGAFAVLDSLPTYRVPVLCTGTGADKLTDLVAAHPDRYRPFFRVMHASRELGATTAAFATELLVGQMGLRRFALLIENAAWTQALRAAWEKAASDHPAMEIVTFETFSAETRDFAPIFHRIAAARADYVLDASSSVDATVYLKQWAALQGPPIGAIPTGAGTRKYYEQIGREGLTVASVSTIPSEVNQATPRSASWWRTYRQRHGDPEYTSAYSYDAVHVLNAAVERAERPDPEAVIAALELTDHAGVAGRWVFGRGHHPKFGPGFRTIPMIQYQEPHADGYRIVWPPDRAQAAFQLPPWRKALPGGPSTG